MRLIDPRRRLVPRAVALCERREFWPIIESRGCKQHAVCGRSGGVPQLLLRPRVGTKELCRDTKFSGLLEKLTALFGIHEYDVRVRFHSFKSSQGVPKVLLIQVGCLHSDHFLTTRPALSHE